MHGSKHLTAAFLFGRVFAPFEMVIRQTSTETWTSYYPPSKNDPFDVTFRQGVLSGRRLFVEIAARNKNLAPGVDSLVAETGIEPSVRLQLYPKDGPLDADNALGRAMVRQAYAAIERVMQTEQVAEVHLFVAAQQAFMVLLGREMKGMPETHLYEWNGNQYVHSCTVPGGVI